MFINGTGDELGTGTNVEKLYHLIKAHPDNDTLYIAGPGTKAAKSVIQQSNQPWRGLKSKLDPAVPS